MAVPFVTPLLPSWYIVIWSAADQVKTFLARFFQICMFPLRPVLFLGFDLTAKWRHRAIHFDIGSSVLNGRPQHLMLSPGLFVLPNDRCQLPDSSQQALINDDNLTATPFKSLRQQQLLLLLLRCPAVKERRLPRSTANCLWLRWRGPIDVAMLGYMIGGGG